MSPDAGPAHVQVDVLLSTLARETPRLSELGSWLSPAERERASGMSAPSTRRLFVVGRGLLREALAERTGVAPSEVAFEHGQAGKPRLSKPSAGPHFNVSHSGTMVGVALSDAGPVGLDLELEGPARDALRLAERWFADRESEEIRALPAAGRREAFLRCWCRKEAVLKAHGGGLASGLAAVQVGTGSAPPGGLLVEVEGRPFYVTDLPATAGVPGAVAHAGTPLSVHLLDPGGRAGR